ncbi:hypothetical protein DXD54_08235 [Clostridium sp. TM06-18]|nr:hypothetical protein [Clostridium sp. TM06-18]RHU37168.1 hypothetical protein DXD54_08235 [Clostridium sp. TM06-18]
MFKLFRFRLFNYENRLLTLAIELVVTAVVFQFVTPVMFSTNFSADLESVVSGIIFGLILIDNSRLKNIPNTMQTFYPIFWKKEFHSAVLHGDWEKIYSYALELSKFFKKYDYFYIYTDTFHDLPLDQLERALNVFSERNPNYFTDQLIETVLSDAENGLESTYLVDFSFGDTLKIKKIE